MSKLEVNTVAPQCGTTLTLGESGDTVTLGTGASQSGFGRTGTVDWVTTVQTSTITAATGKGYFVNTTAGAITANLPAGTAGSIVSFADYAATWQNNNLTISPNGSEKIGGNNADVALSTEGQSVTLVYIDSTQGWINTMDSTSNVRANPYITATGGTITTSGNDKIHTFTGPGTFTVCKIASSCASVNNLVSYVVVAGGGSSGKGAGSSGGGGGAGGYREVVSPGSPYTGSPLNGYPTPSNRITVTASSYPITVGGGGADGTANGSSSIFSTITSTGGGLGASAVPSHRAAATGGSGGGGDGECNPSGGAGNTPSVTPAQGNSGGNGVTGAGARAGGGGGGAGAAGTNATSPQNAGPGGNGVTSEITGSPVARGGGGGGQKQSGPYAGASTGGSGGGGAAATCGTAGSENTGGGAGASANSPATSASGGSGVVIIRYRYQ